MKLKLKTTKGFNYMWIDLLFNKQFIFTKFSENSNQEKRTIEDMKYQIDSSIKIELRNKNSLS